MLLSKLELLTRRIIEETTSHINNGEEKEFARDYLKPEFYEFSYEPYGIRYSVDLVRQEEIEWSPFDRALFVQNVIRALPEYEEVQNAIRKECPTNEKNWRAAVALVGFAESIASKTYEGKSGKVLDKYISILINDLNGNPIEWKCKSWLTGIWLEEESYEVLPGLSIRRPKPIDLEEEWVLSIESMKHFGYKEEFAPLIPTILDPGSKYGRLASPRKGGSLDRRTVPKLSAILKLACRARDSYEVSRRVALILDCMTFFGTGAAFQIETAMHPESFAETPFTSAGPARIPFESDERTPFRHEYRGDYYQYELDKPDIPRLAAFIKEMRALYPGHGIVYSLKIDSPVTIAFRRYQSAFLWSGESGIAGQIASAMMALEALLLKEEERAELAYKLSLRTAALLKFYGFDPIEVYHDVKKSYNIRNKFVHGSVKLTIPDEDALQRAKKALTYARNALLLFLQLKICSDKDEAGLGKEAFIDEIDESWLQQSEHSELGQRLSKLRLSNNAAGQTDSA